MKTFILKKLITPSFVLYCLLFLQSCTPDETPDVGLATISFVSANLSLKETDGEQSIGLFLDKALDVETKVTISVLASPIGAFTTIPAIANSRITLPVPAGTREVAFRFLPSDNANLDGSKQVSFSIVKTGGPYTTGGQSSTTVEIADDEVASTVGFPPLSLQVNEDALVPTPVVLSLSAPAPAEGMVILELSSDARYGVDFYTVPAVVDGRIFLPVQFGSTDLSFSVVPVNDAVRRHDRLIAIEMVYGSGGVCTGSKANFEAVIRDDDNYELHGIDQLKTLYTGVVHQIADEYFVEGLVTSVDNITPGKFFIEDESGAIRVNVSSGKSFAKGEVVLLNLKQALVDKKQGVLEVAGDINATLVTSAPVVPMPLSLQELADPNDFFHARYVQLSNLRFDDADGATLMYGDHQATDGERTIIVRTTGFASFRDEALPNGELTISGILTFENGHPVLHPQVFQVDVVSGNSSLRPWNPSLPGGKPVRGIKK